MGVFITIDDPKALVRLRQNGFFIPVILGLWRDDLQIVRFFGVAVDRRATG